MAETKQKHTAPADRRPDCVTEIRMGNSVLVVSAFSRKTLLPPPPTKWLRCWKPKPPLHKNRHFDGR